MRSKSQRRWSEDKDINTTIKRKIGSYDKREMKEGGKRDDCYEGRKGSGDEVKRRCYEEEGKGGKEGEEEVAVKR